MKIIINIPEDSERDCTAHVELNAEMSLIPMHKISDAISTAYAIRRYANIASKVIQDCWNLAEVDDNGNTNTPANKEFRLLMSLGWQIDKIEACPECGCGKETHVKWHMKKLT